MNPRQVTIPLSREQRDMLALAISRLATIYMGPKHDQAWALVALLDNPATDLDCHTSPSCAARAKAILERKI
jgi:hypothetical protein